MRIQAGRVGVLVIAALVLAGCCWMGRGPQAPLARAAAAGDAATVRSLVSAGADPDEMDRSRLTPLMWAARGGSVEAIEALVAKGARLDTKDRAVNGWTALIHAIHKGRDGAVSALLEAGADPNVTGDGGATPLMYAAAYGNTRIVRELLARGADPRAEATGGVTALWNAAGGGGLFDFTDGPALGTCHPDIVEALLEKAPDFKLHPDFSARILKALSRSESCAALRARLEG